MTHPELVRVVPRDLYPAYEGRGQFPPEVDTERFDQALIYELAHGNAPPEYADAYEFPPELREWAAESRTNQVLLRGSVGVGKTYSAVAACCLYSALHGVTFRMILAGEYLRGVKSYEDKEHLETVKGNAFRPGILLLDDIGRSKLSETDIESMTELLDFRRSNLKPTIFTSNLNVEDFEEYFGEHLKSRILGGTLVIKMNGDDRR